MRSSTVAADVMIRRLFASWLLPDAWPERGHYSLILGPTVPSRAGERALSILFADGVPIVRSRSARRVLRALATHLASYGAGPAPAGLLRLKAVAVVGDRGGVLLPAGVFGHFDLCRLERELTRMRLRLVDQPWVQVDPATAELVLAPPTSLPAEEAVAGLTAICPEERADNPPVGRFPLVAWVVAPPPSGTPMRPPTRSEAAAHGLTLLIDPDVVASRLHVEQMAALTASCSLVPFVQHSLDETLAALGAALDI